MHDEIWRFIEYRNDDVTKTLFFAFPSVFEYHNRWNMMKNIHRQNLVAIGFEPGQFTLISMVVIRYSCGNISGHHVLVHVKFDVWGFYVLLKSDNENAEMQILMTSHFSSANFINFYCLCYCPVLLTRNFLLNCFKYWIYHKHPIVIPLTLFYFIQLKKLYSDDYQNDDNVNISNG